ncbi:hypothetical protein ACINIS116_1046 [Acinetobacter baumannii IS-116]|nr:hypothetical protein ACINIS116_1046 [Acinetobacter baumannii IS-116]
MKAGHISSTSKEAVKEQFTNFNSIKNSIGGNTVVTGW